MDINSTFDMSRITGITSTDSINSEKAHGESFVGSLGAVNNSNESPHQKALKAFYQVHQRSQITGVPTSEYNEAIAALGLDKGQSFAATDMLNKAGFDTGMPSVAAILRYGNTNNTSVGNLSFLKGGADVLAQRAKVGIIPTVLETKKYPLQLLQQACLKPLLLKHPPLLVTFMMQQWRCLLSLTQHNLNNLSMKWRDRLTAPTTRQTKNN